MSETSSANTVKRRRAGSNPSNANAHVTTRTIEQLLKANLELTKQVVELARLAIEERKPVAPVPQTLVTGTVPAPVLPVEQPWSTEPLYETEEVEDAKYQFRHGQIDSDELRSILTQAGYQNTDIDLTL